MEKRRLILKYIGGILLFSLAAFLRSRGLYIPACIAFLILAAAETVLLYRESGKLLDLRVLLTLSWIGGLSLTVLNLSELQADWPLKTWFITGGFYFLFLAGADFLSVFFPAETRKKDAVQYMEKNTDSRVYKTVCILFALVFFCFMTESVVFGFDYPVFSDKPHAYTSFHLTGFHYFVVSTPFVHAISVWLWMRERPTGRRLIMLIVMNLICLLISLMILSKLQLFYSVVMSLTVWIMCQRKMSTVRLMITGLAAGAFFIAAVFFVILMRKYPEGYLQEIFRFRNRSVSLGIQYPYIYIVNNFENLNLLINADAALTMGRRILSPFLCLSGLKFIPAVAAWMSCPSYFTVPELTTLTILYDVCGDFGAPGAYFFGILFGAAAAGLMKFSRDRGIGVCLLYGQAVIYTSLAFFTTWFSNPTVWFYLVLTAIIGLYSFGGRKHDERKINQIYSDK